MKVKHILIIFGIGIILMMTGTLFRINHWPGGFMLVTISTLVKVIATVLAIWKILTIDKGREFLNS